MGYNIRQIGLAEARAQSTSYSYALLYMISGVKLCRAEGIGQIDWEECQEARFFSEGRELHVFEGEDGMKAVEVTDADGNGVIIKEFLLDNRFSSVGSSVLVQEYLEYDEDGQAYVANTRLKGIC